jgi:2-methylcitrate dehydratase PrpD
LQRSDGSPGASCSPRWLPGSSAGRGSATSSNPEHYARGWHATSTLGVFAAAAACSNAIGLDAAAACSALGLAAVQAAGLRSAFGSPAKPLQVGRAAANGLLAALLAESGVRAGEDLMDGEAGFLATYDQSFDRRRAISTGGGGDHAIRATLFKHHASCHGTHATLTAISRLCEAAPLEPFEISAVQIAVPDQLRGVCGIEQPSDAATLRFSLRGVAAMALAGFDTSDPAAFAPSVLEHPAYRHLLGRTEVRYVAGPAGFGGQARVEIHHGDAATRSCEVDITIPETNVGTQREALEGKFERLVTPVLGSERTTHVAAIAASLHKLGDVVELLEICRAGSPRRPRPLESNAVAQRDDSSLALPADASPRTKARTNRKRTDR